MDKIVVDANVLFSNTLRGLFLWLISENVIEVVWTTEIWEEVFRNYSEDLEKEKLFRAQISKGPLVIFDYCMRTLKAGYTLLGLPDKDDEHITALALQERSLIVVTFNMKDFPESIMEQHSLKSVHPDAYLADLLVRKEDTVIRAVMSHIQANSISKPTKAQYIASLTRANVPNFGKALTTLDSVNRLPPEIWA